MMSQRKHLYPPNWKQLATACKEGAGWRCQSCHIRHGAKRRSKRTGNMYRVWLHAAHVTLHDTLNPQPALKCLCPRCHGRYDYRQRVREARLSLERLKHQILLQRHKGTPGRCSVYTIKEQTSCQHVQQSPTAMPLCS